MTDYRISLTALHDDMVAINFLREVMNDVATGKARVVRDKNNPGSGAPIHVIDSGHDITDHLRAAGVEIPVYNPELLQQVPWFGAKSIPVADLDALKRETASLRARTRDNQATEAMVRTDLLPSERALLQAISSRIKELEETYHARVLERSHAYDFLRERGHPRTDAEMIVAEWYLRLHTGTSTMQLALDVAEEYDCDLTDAFVVTADLQTRVMGVQDRERMRFLLRGMRRSARQGAVGWTL